MVIDSHLKFRFILVASLLWTLSACKDKDREQTYYEPAPPTYYPPPSSVPHIYSSVPAPTPSANLSVPVLSASPEIRVAVLKDVSSIKVTAPISGAKIVLNGQAWKQLPPGAVVNVTQSGTTLLLEGQPANAPSVRFETFSTEQFMKLDDRDISACVVLSRPATRSGILAIAQLGIEDYLSGVLAGEVPYQRWHAEALKVQAVVSRTYALYEVRAHQGEAYDVENTIMSQVFKGGYRNIPSLSMAINSTRGQVLTSGGVVFPAFFHSTCGGSTAPAMGVFPEHSGVKPLSGIACPYCTISPAHRWTARFSKDTIAQKLSRQIPNIGKIESITFADNKGAPIGTSSADLRRVQTVTVKHSNGTNALQGNIFRLAVSPKELKSLLFGLVLDKGDALEISGGGFGHGVGLCQYGSQGMAQAGEPYTRVLGFYFPTASLTRMY